MIKSILLWILALIITLASAVYQRKTGPTYPISGQAELKGSIVEYDLLRSHGGSGDQPVVIFAPDTSLSAELVFRRYKTEDVFTRLAMQREGDSLKAWLPHQPPAGKLEYHVELKKNTTTVSIPKDENAVTRFKGAVPNWALVPHVFFMFFAMLLSTRTGLQALRKQASVKGLLYSTILFLILGGFVFGPIVQKFAFGDFWTGFPFGTDLTDNKTLIALVAWAIALVAFLRRPPARWWIVAASLVMLVIFMVPHSLHGSELDYSEPEQHLDVQDMP